MTEILSQNPAALTLLVFLFSLLIGSFLNVVIHRLPIMMMRQWRKDIADEWPEVKLPDSEETTTERYNLSVPRSACPKCGHKISALENIPLLSWLVLGGKCKACKAPISIRYPAVELLTALVSAFAAFQFGFGWNLAAILLLSWSLIALIFIDADTMLLPDQITLPLLWLGLLFNLAGGFVSLENAVIGAAAGYLSLWSVYWGFKLLTGKEGMGYGDFKLLAAIGAWLGWQQLPVIILLSSVVGAVLGIAAIVIQGRDRAKPMPFGPYLAIAGWIALYWGDTLVESYLATL